MYVNVYIFEENPRPTTSVYGVPPAVSRNDSFS